MFGAIDMTLSTLVSHILSLTSSSPHGNVGDRPIYLHWCVGDEEDILNEDYCHHGSQRLDLQCYACFCSASDDQ